NCLRLKAGVGFGSLRGRALAGGLREIDTDSFGMIDDDDILHRNHVPSLMRTFRYNNQRDFRGDIKVAYSARYYCSDYNTFIEEPQWADEYMDPKPRHRVLEHFRFYDSAAMANHRWYMMSNSWLASKTALDEELFKDPNSNTGEDLFFELQFAMKGYFAFSCEMTAVHWFHNTNSTVIDRHRHEADYFRHALHFLGRAFPAATPYKARFYSGDSHIGQIELPSTFVTHNRYVGPQQPPPGPAFGSTFRNNVKAFMSVWREQGFRTALRLTLLYFSSRL